MHGDHGAAGPWAATATPGQPAYLMGPSGAYSPDPAADWHLMAGDETALPAISVALEALPANAIGQVFIEVADPDDEIPLAAPEGVQIRWIYRGGRADLVGEERAGDHAPLIEAVKAAQWLPGQVQVFMHGEAQAVMHNLRPYIRKERGVDAKWASISGYWRRGRTEETFRQWKKELAAAEAGTQLGCRPDCGWHARRMAFGDYQLEIYLQGLAGVVPSLPMAFAELEAKAERRCRRRCGPTSPAARVTSAPSGPTSRRSSTGA